MNPLFPEVATQAGVVRGTRTGGVFAFRGIPYAQPPVNNLRFAAPAPMPPWQGVRDASHFGPLPPQSALAGPAPTIPSPGTDPDEWLTVNVWSPSLRESALPVLVWIYGGAYVSGGTTSPLFDGARIAREGNVVLVTFNYRLAVEGFAQLAGAPANRGLLDQLAALRWVRDTITAFGGNPHEITVWGQSAGGGAVTALLTMPEAAGLFKRAIVQSVPRVYLSPELASAVATELAATVSANATRTDLMTISPQHLMLASDALMRRLPTFADRWGQLAEAPSLYAPVVDGVILPQNPWRALSKGAGREVDLLTGHTRDEYRLFLALAGQRGTITPEQTERALRIFAPVRASHLFQLMFRL